MERKKLQRVDIGPVLGGEATQSFDCDLLVTAVGLMPRLSLLSMGRSRPEWDPERQILRIFDLPENMYAVGEVEGSADISRLLQEGMQTGIAASKGNVQPKFERKPEEMIEALPADIESGGDHHFICKCMDVTRKEACVSIDEGFDSDTDGVDDLEFVELKTDNPYASLDGYVLVFFNGSTSGNDSSYFTIDLDGFTSDTNTTQIGGYKIGTDFPVTVNNESGLPDFELYLNPLIVEV